LSVLEVIENDAIMAKIKENNPRLATRFEMIAASEGSSFKVGNKEATPIVSDGKLVNLNPLETGINPKLPYKYIGYKVVPEMPVADIYAKNVAGRKSWTEDTWRAILSKKQRS